MKNDFQEADIAIINQETFSIKNLQQLADQIIGDWTID
jgi:hypothetical protein